MRKYFLLLLFAISSLVIGAHQATLVFETQKIAQPVYYTISNHDAFVKILGNSFEQTLRVIAREYAHAFSNPAQREKLLHELIASHEKILSILKSCNGDLELMLQQLHITDQELQIQFFKNPLQYFLYELKEIMYQKGKFVGLQTEQDVLKAAELYAKYLQTYIHCEKKFYTCLSRLAEELPVFKQVIKNFQYRKQTWPEWASSFMRTLFGKRYYEVRRIQHKSETYKSHQRIDEEINRQKKSNFELEHVLDLCSKKKYDLALIYAKERKLFMKHPCLKETVLQDMRKQETYTQAKTIEQNGILNKATKQEIKDHLVGCMGQEQKRVAGMFQEYEENNEFYTQEHKESIQEGKKAFENLDKQEFKEETYVISQEAENLLEQNNIDATTFTFCFGNDAQHEIQKKLIAILVKALVTLKKKEHQKLVAQISEASAELNHNGKVTKAFKIVNFLWAGFDCQSDFFEGIDLPLQLAKLDEALQERLAEQRAQEQQRKLQEQEKMRQAEQRALEKQRLELSAQQLENAHEKYSWSKEDFKRQLIDEGKIVCDAHGRVIECDPEVLHRYNHYQFKGYRALLEEIPGFDQAIKDIQHRLKTDKEFRQAMQNLQGFTSDGFVRRINFWGVQVELLDEYKAKNNFQLTPLEQKAIMKELFEGKLQRDFEKIVEQEKPKMREMHAELAEFIKRGIATPEQIEIYKAMDQILNGQIVWGTKKFDLSLNTYQMLVDLGIEPTMYEECFGHQLQHEVQKQLVKDINKWTALQRAFGENKVSIISGLFYEYSGLGIIYNRVCRSTDAMTCSDFCVAFLDTVESVGAIAHSDRFGASLVGVGINLVRAGVEGSAGLCSGDTAPFSRGAEKGLHNTYQFYRHLDKSIIHIAKGIGALWEKLTYIEPTYSKAWEVYQKEGYEKAEPLFKLAQERIGESQSAEAWDVYLTSLVKPIRDCPSVNIIETTTEIGVEFIANDLITRSVGRALGAFGRAISNPETLEFVERHTAGIADFIEKQGPHAPQFVTPEGIIIELTPISDFIIEAVEVSAVAGEVVEGASPLVNAMSQFGKFNKDSEKAVGGGTEAIPNFIKENKVPKDFETILKKDPSFVKTNMPTKKGALVYKKGKFYYHRDTLHRGKGAHLEVYNKRRIHVGKADPLTGEIIPGTAIKGRKLSN